MEVINNSRVIYNLVDAYVKLRSKIEIHALRRFNVVVIMKPEIFNELRYETPEITTYRDKEFECYFIYLCGIKTPLLINYELPEEVEFQVMTQHDYERLEQEKLYERFNNMFFNY